MNDNHLSRSYNKYLFFLATTSLKRQTVSQHSSISQADDVSSPYARVKSPVHAYDKLRIAEHPYAQLVQPGTSSSGYFHIMIKICSFI